MLDILCGEMSEPALAEQILFHGFPLADTLGNRPAGAVQHQLAFDYLVLYPQAGLDGQHTQFVRVLGVVVPALWARVYAMDESGSA